MSCHECHCGVGANEKHRLCWQHCVGLKTTISQFGPDCSETFGPETSPVTLSLQPRVERSAHGRNQKGSRSLPEMVSDCWN